MNLFINSIVQVEGLSQKEIAGAAFHQSISDIAAKAAFKSGFLNCGITTGAESVIGVPVGNLLDNATQK